MSSTIAFSRVTSEHSSPAHYQVGEEISQGANARIYRAVRVRDGQSVILKVQLREQDAREVTKHHRNELEIVQAIKSHRVIRCFGSEPFADSTVLVLEDIGGRSLRDLMSTGPLPLEQALQYGIWIAEGLHDIHTSNVIHKDISPDNIIVNEKSHELKIIDFGHSTVLQREQQALVNPGILAGTLAYMSPEQTGRMNRAIDYRSDFYSFGATLYHMLSGHPPFFADDPLDLAHFHIAKQAAPLHEMHPHVPEAVSRIVMKLLAKTAEDRYQSAWGIKADLENCLHQWHASRAIQPFALAAHDTPHQFQIPQKLYGRQNDVDTLLSQFDDVVSGARRVVYIGGYSGIGKTSLVREVYKSMTESRGYFISGKFNQFQRGVPYQALLDAVRDLVKQLLTEDEQRLNYWRERIQSAVGAGGQLIIDAIPDIEIIIGPQPAVPRLEPAETQNRINLVFRNFLTVFCHADHPLIIFLDDLQWVDSASLKFLTYLLRDESIRHLMLIGTFRNNEVDQTHPLMVNLQSLRKNGVSIETLILKPLKLEDVVALVSEAVRSDGAEVQMLAELIIAKTDGNPFFIEEFLKSLHSEQLLSFDARRGSWEWDVDKIRMRGITDNVVDLMTAKLERLDPDTKRVVSLAACLGNRFDIHTLASIYQRTVDATIGALRQALQLGLLDPVGSSSDWLMGGRISDREAARIECRFSHDRVQQAAYLLIPAEEKPAVHKSIGTLMLANTPADGIDDKIFDIVTQLHQGAFLIDDESEREQLARLTLRAARIAKYSGASDAAYGFMQAMSKVMPKDCWQRDYKLSFKIAAATLDAAYLSGNAEEVRPLMETALAQADNVLDRIKLYELKINAELEQGRMAAATGLALEALEWVGVKLPAKPSWMRVLWHFARLKISLLKLDPERAVSASEPADPLLVAKWRLLGKIGHASFGMNQKLFMIEIFESLRLSLEHPGVRTNSSIYATYGIILAGAMGDIDGGSRYGELAHRIANGPNPGRDIMQSRLTVDALIRHWKEPARDLLPELIDDYQASLDSGDLLTASNSALCYCFMSFHCGKELPTLEQDFVKYNAALKGWLHQPRFYLINSLYHQATLNMMGKGSDPCALSGDDEEVLKKWKAAKNGLVVHTYYFLKQYLCFYFGRFEDAVRFSDLARALAGNVVGALTIPVAVFYDSLARLAVCPKAEPQRKRKLLRDIAANQKKMKKWTHHAPENHAHRYFLVQAEIDRVAGKEIDALNNYEEAIFYAKKNAYLQEEALANELAAKFNAEKARKGVADAYFRQARQCYQQWGAAAKSQELQQTFPQLISQKKRGDGSGSTSGSLTRSVSPHSFDLHALTKALKNIAQEKTHSQLIEKTILTAMECAGADSGLLILCKTSDALFVEAEIVAGEGKPRILQSIPLDQASGVSHSVVNYVRRTQRSVVIEDALEPQDIVPNLWKDPYITSKRIKSILCIPLMTEAFAESGELIGVLYLENNQASNAFDEQRIGILEIICLAAAGRLELSRKAMTDGLTELFNHDAFQSMLKKEFSASMRTRRPVSVVMIDVDHFKKFNDTWGHQVGDMVLKLVASKLKESCRQSDVVARYGGEEMIAILPDTDQDVAMVVAERIRANIESTELLHQGSVLKVTASLGISTSLPDTKDVAELIRTADAALYKSKEKGRNRISTTQDA